MTTLRDTFQAHYDTAPDLLVRAPGRVNLIGEHTDYNGGFVLPAAIDREITIAATGRADDRVRVYAQNYGESVEFRITDSGVAEALAARHWSSYTRGAVAWLAAQGGPITGADLVITSDLPTGGTGLSTSAALLVGLLYTFGTLAGETPPRAWLASAAQAVENEQIGVPVGPMDPLIIAHARAGHALLIDCRSLEIKAVPLHFADAGVSLAVVHSGVSRGLAGSEYVVRRRQCEEATAQLAALLPGMSIRSLRDVTPEMLNRVEGKLDPLIFRRARHVVTENWRVLESVWALNAANVEALGRFMNASHASLRDDYEVSSPELDLLVGLSQAQPYVWGARLTGAGFGGATVHLVQTTALDDFTRDVVDAYAAQSGRTPRLYVTQAVNGVSTL
jgi:galactokinase